MNGSEFPGNLLRSGSQRALFVDRADAGRALAAKLRAYAGRKDVLVLGLPRGGVPVAAVVAATLGAPLDVWLVRKLGVPHNEEFAMGALSSDGIVELDRDLIRELAISQSAILETVQRERAELERRERAYRLGRPVPDLHGRTVIVVDDGLATGSTMRAAVRAVRCHLPAQIIVAVPVASRQACAELAGRADVCVCVAQPEPFGAVGRWYQNFDPTSDEEVLASLQHSAARDPGQRSTEPGSRGFGSRALDAKGGGTLP